jgi:hypothetical protein
MKPPVGKPTGGFLSLQFFKVEVVEIENKKRDNDRDNIAQHFIVGEQINIQKLPRPAPKHHDSERDDQNMEDAVPSLKPPVYSHAISLAPVFTSL